MRKGRTESKHMTPNDNPQSPRRAFLIFLLIVVPILLFIGWSEASLNLSFIHPKSAGQTILLVVVSTLIFLAFVIFALILARNLLKLYVEAKQQARLAVQDQDGCGVSGLDAGSRVF